MGRWQAVLAAILMISGAWGDEAADGARAKALVTLVQRQLDGMLRDGEVQPSRSALFRGPLREAADAIAELATLGAPGRAGLEQLLSSQRAQLRANAAYGLGLAGGPEIVAPLLRRLDDEASEAVRYHIVQALGFSASQVGLDALERLAGDNSAVVRTAAVEVAGMVREVLRAQAAGGQAEQLAALVTLLHAEAACRRMVAFGAAAVPALIEALDHKDGGIAAGAAWCLAQIGAEEGLEALWTRYEKTKAAKFSRYLAAYRNPKVVDYLKRLLATDDIQAQYFAVERLADLDEVPVADRRQMVNAFLQAQIEKRIHREREVRGEVRDINAVAAACGVLERIGDASSLPLLNQIIDEARSERQSILKPLATQAKAAIEQRSR